MGSEASHLALANHNQALIEFLWTRSDEFPDWVVTVAFYKALHIVEAVFFNDPVIRHGTGHPDRERLLKSNRKYNHIWASYRELYAASITARYLEGISQGTTFADTYSPEIVRTRLLAHHLHQVEQSACKFLARPGDLKRFAAPGPLPDTSSVAPPPT